MFRKSKIEPVEKVKIVERYLAGEIGIQQAGKELGVDHHSIRNWISIYQYDGPTGLLNQPKNKSYSKDLKISAINDYLNGEGSLQDICTKYGIRSHRQLSDWIKVYNSGGILKTSTGGAYMKKAKNTTLDERLKIVTDCLANDKNYGAMALKYGCSYQQVRNWVIRYEKMGQAGLEDRRGRRIASLPSRTPEEIPCASHHAASVNPLCLHSVTSSIQSSKERLGARLSLIMKPPNVVNFYFLSKKWSKNLSSIIMS